VFPGSIHEESGELVEWAVEGEPGRYDFATLAAAQRKLSLACVLLKAWRELGVFHRAAMAGGGFLARAGWSVDDIRYFVEVIAEKAGSDDSLARGEDAVDAAENFAKGGNTFGLPKLREIFGAKTANKMAGFAGYREAPDPASIKDTGKA